MAIRDLWQSEQIPGTLQASLSTQPRGGFGLTLYLIQALFICLNSLPFAQSGFRCIYLIHGLFSSRNFRESFSPFIFLQWHTAENLWQHEGNGSCLRCEISNKCANVFSVSMNCCVCRRYLQPLSVQAGQCFPHQFCNLPLIILKNSPNLSVSLLPHSAALFQIAAVVCSGFGWWFFPCSKKFPFSFPLRTWLLRNLLKHLLILLQNDSGLVSRRILKSEIGITEF